MKKIYLIYVSIPRSVFDDGVKFILSNQQEFTYDDTKGMYGLYAWSNKKDIIEEFFEGRVNKIYDLKTIEFDDKDEYKKFKSDKSQLRLDYRDYLIDKSIVDGMVSSRIHGDIPSKELTADDIVKIVTTQNEHYQTTEEGDENLYEFGPKPSDFFDYMIFNDKIIKALDWLNYSSKYDDLYSDKDRREWSNYNKSFNMSLSGNYIMDKFNNEINILLYLFHYFFYGKK